MTRTRIALFTIVEVVGLALWLVLSTTATNYIAAGVLLAFLIGEHILSFNTARSFPLLSLRELPLKRIVGFSITELVAWIVWLILARETNIGFASGALFVGLWIEHNQAENTGRHREFFGDLLDGQTFGFTFIEVVGAAAWFSLVGMGQEIAGTAALAIAIFIQHVMAIKLARTPR